MHRAQSTLQECNTVFYLLNCSEQQVKDAMDQLKELVHSELHKYAEELVGKVASVS